MVQIIIIYRERQKLGIPEEIQDLYEKIFHTKSHREIIHFWDQGKICQIEKETLITSVDIQTDLMLILTGKSGQYSNPGYDRKTHQIKMVYA